MQFLVGVAVGAAAMYFRSSLASLAKRLLDKLRGSR